MGVTDVILFGIIPGVVSQDEIEFLERLSFNSGRVSLVAPPARTRDKTRGDIGFTIPQSMLLRADKSDPPTGRRMTAAGRFSTGCKRRQAVIR